MLQVFQSEGDFAVEVWSFPAIVGNRIYLRSDTEIACVILNGLP
jgi:hypothetical protein